MQDITYTILLHRGEWNIECNGEYYGPHRNKETAVKLAVEAAKLAKRDGDSARVVVQDRDYAHTEWQYTREPNFAFAW